MIKTLRLLICVWILIISEHAAIGAEEKWVFIEKDQGMTILEKASCPVILVPLCE